MADLLIDTDVFVDHLRGSCRLRLGSDRGWYSVVTRCELFAGRAVEEDGVRRLLEPFGEIPVNRVIAERAGRLRRETGTQMADALIAATALCHDLVLITRNTPHFKNVPGLRMLSPCGEP